MMNAHCTIARFGRDDEFTESRIFFLLAIVFGCSVARSSHLAPFAVSKNYDACPREFFPPLRELHRRDVGGAGADTKDCFACRDANHFRHRETVAPELGGFAV
jgi:hypothetical protein